MKLVVEDRLRSASVRNGPHLLRFVIGHEHAGGCLRGASARGAGIGDGHGGAAPRQLPSNGAADHSGAGNKYPHQWMICPLSQDVTLTF